MQKRPLKVKARIEGDQASKTILFCFSLQAPT